MKIYLLAIAMFVCVGAAQAVYVYQETATTSVGLGTLSNGSYAFGNNSTNTALGYFYVNYSMPTTAFSAPLIWQVRHGNLSTYNITLPLSCLQTNRILSFRMDSQVTDGFGSLGGGVFCYNTTSQWESIGTTFGVVIGSIGATTFGDTPKLQAYDTDYGTYVFYQQNNGWSKTITSDGAVQPIYLIYEEGVYWYFTNTLNMTFYDEGTGGILSGTTVTYYATNGLNTFNGTTTTGNALISSDMYQDDYIVTYSASGFEPRSSIVSVDAFADTASLYLLNSTDATNVLIGVYDTFTNRVGGADVYAQKKNLSGTNYYTVESCVTDARGECLMNLELYDTTYRFLIYYNGELKLNSNDTKISQATISFIINLQSFNVADLFEIASIAGNVTTNATSFTFNYSDGYDIITMGCLETVRRTGASLVTTATNCTTTTTGSVTLSFSNATGDEWIGNGYVVLASNGRRYDVASESYIVSEFKTQFGRVGLFYFGFLLLGTMVFSAMYSIIASMVMAGVGVWVLNALGFISIGMSAAVSLLIIIVIYIITVKNT